MADRYYVAGPAWNLAANWSLVSGGAGGAGVPGIADKAIFDINSPNCIVDAGFSPSISQLELQGGGTAFANTLDLNDRPFTTSGTVTVAAGILLLKTGTVTFNGGLTQTGGTITHAIGASLVLRVGWTKTGGVWNSAGGTVTFTATGIIINANGESLYAVIFNTPGNVTIAGGTNIIVTGWIQISAANTFQGGTINIRGPLLRSLRTVPFSSPTTVFLVDGGGAQNFNTAGGIGYLPDLTVNKAGGTLTISNNLGLRNFIWLAGAVDFLTNTTLVVFRETTVITPGALNFYDVDINSSGNITLTGTLIVTRDFELINSNFIGAGIIQVGRNFTANTDPATVGNTAFVLNGAGAQSVDVNGGDLPNGNFTIDKLSGVATLIAPFAPPSWTGNLVVARGTLNLDGFNIVAAGSTLDVNDTLQRDGSETVTVAAWDIDAISSTIELIDAAVTADMSFLAGDTIYNLVFGDNKRHEFATGAGNQLRVNGMLQARGSPSTPSVLRSAVPGTQWFLNLQGVSLLGDKVDVQDSDANAGLLVGALGSVDMGNNENWDFGGPVFGAIQAHAQVDPVMPLGGSSLGSFHAGGMLNYHGPISGSGGGGGGPGPVPGPGPITDLILGGDL